MRLLWIGTKSPWPPTDGGRLVAAETIRALVDSGVELTVVAPGGADDAEEPPDGIRERCTLRTVPRSSLPFPLALVTSLATRRPLAVVRHRSAALADAVADLLAGGDFDVVHVEQVHALPQADSAFRRGLPVVLRAHNVESDLWSQTSEIVPSWLRSPLAWEAGRLERFEAGAVRRCTRTVALTEDDAATLSHISGREVAAVPPPFPARLPAADVTLPGDPPIVVLGSGGWRPNVDAARRFVDEIWPAIARAVPGARGHLVGAMPRGTGDRAGVTVHVPPAQSRAAFPSGAVLLVPLRIASGIRMKILEAWARGIPVVATPAAASGLQARDGHELLLARGPAEIARAVSRLAAEAPLRGRLVKAGRTILRRRHDPGRAAAHLSTIYRDMAR